MPSCIPPDTLLKHARLITVDYGKKLKKRFQRKQKLHVAGKTAIVSKYENASLCEKVVSIVPFRVCYCQVFNINSCEVTSRIQISYVKVIKYNKTNNAKP